MVFAAVIVFLCLYIAMDSEIYAQNEEQHRTYMSEPFLEGSHLARKVADTYRAVTY